MGGRGGATFVERPLLLKNRVPTVTTIHKLKATNCHHRGKKLAKSIILEFQLA